MGIHGSPRQLPAPCRHGGRVDLAHGQKNGLVSSRFLGRPIAPEAAEHPLPVKALPSHAAFDVVVDFAVRLHVGEAVVLGKDAVNFFDDGLGFLNFRDHTLLVVNAWLQSPLCLKFLQSLIKFLWKPRLKKFIDQFPPPIPHVPR